MNLQHTPGHTVRISDTFTDPETGATYRAGYDEFADDPRRYWDSRAELFVYNSAIRTTDDRAAEPEHPAIMAFLYYYDNDTVPRGTDRAEHALAKARRYMAAFYPGSRDVIRLVPGHGYDQGSWHDAIIALINDGYEADQWSEDHAEEFGEEYTGWRYGDVYWVENVDTGDALHGIYAVTMEDAVRYFIEGGY